MEAKILEECIETIDLFAIATDVEAKIIDANGRVLHSVNEPTCENCICDCVPSSACRGSHFFGAQQSLLFNGAYIFFCPIGLVHFISPIIIKNKMVGALLGGHFIMTEPDVYLIKNILKYMDDDKHGIEQLSSYEKKVIEGEKAIKDFVQSVRVFEPNRVKALSEVLKKLANQISDGSEVIKKELDKYNLVEAKHHHSIHKVVNYIKENYMLKISLEDAAKEVHFTTQYLSKIFKEETGYTFKQFLALTRIEKSKKLLLQEDLPHSEVAYLTGFSDQSHFSKSFKKVTGITPRNFQTSNSVY